MKRILLIFSLFLLNGIYSQDVKPVDKSGQQAVKKRKALTAEKMIRLEAKPIKHISVRKDVLGDFEVINYTIYSNKSPSKKDLNQLIGTVVRIQETNMTGSEIDPLSFEIYEIERMSNTDYIYRVFGKNIHEAETNLPEHFAVHKTTNENCYGLVDLGNGEIVIPYKGVLLYLKRK